MSEDIKVTDGTILEALNDKVDIDFDNVASNSVSFARMSREVTNCITEIPQRIKLELNNGTLTLKAGSIVTIPNGNGIFNELIINSDTSYTNLNLSNIPHVAFVNSAGELRIVAESVQSASGSTAPTVSAVHMLWYDTTNNVVKLTSDSGASYNSGYSLPIAILNVTNNKMTSIKQVFNGFGCIGKRPFVHKGVKMLVANGHNGDGTIKNRVIETTSCVVSLNDSATGHIPFFRIHRIYNAPQIYCIHQEWFLGEVNYVPTIDSTIFQWYFNTNEMKWYMHEVGETQWFEVPYYNISPPMTVTNDVTTSFEPYKAFRAVDYNDFEKTPRIVEVYLNGKSGYHVYSNGYCEQWGYLVAGSANYTGVTVTLLKPFKDTNYNITDSVATKNDSGNFNIKDFGVADVATSYFTYRLESSNYLQGVYWKACGYIA